MKSYLWMFTVIVIGASVGTAAAPTTEMAQLSLRRELTELAQAQAEQQIEQPLSAEGQAEAKRKEFVDRLSELYDRDSVLDKQAIRLTQEVSVLHSQMKQNKLENKRVRTDQKDVKRNIKKLEREKGIFNNKDKRRKQMDSLRSGS